MRHFAVLLFAGGLLFPAGLGAAEPAADAARIKGLIARLASPNFKDRERASEELEQSGESALPLLMDALKNPDLEVRQRAEDIIPRVEVRLETARALVPMRVQYSCKDLTVAEAIREFSAQTGHPIQITGNDQARVANRHVTIDIAPTTFWDAFDQLCSAAGLREMQTATEAQPILNAYSSRVMMARGRRGWAVNYGGMPRGGVDATLVLEDGSRQAGAVARTGSLRIRTLPPKSAVFTDLPDGGKQIALQLEVRAESRIDLIELLGLKVTRATDEAGRKVRSTTDYVGDGFGGLMDPEMQMMIAQQLEILNGAVTGSPHNLIPIAIVVDKPIDRLGELGGVLCARVRTAPEPLISMDDVSKSVGKTQRALDGSEVKITECKRDADGLLKVKVEFQSTQYIEPGNDGLQVQIAQMQQMRLGRVRAAFVQGGEMPKIQLTKANAGSIPFKLVNEKSDPLEFVNGELEMNPNNDTSRTYTLVYKPAANDAEPTKFQYIGRREVVIEVPFSLKNVPVLAPANK